MGLLIEGKWSDQWYDTKSSKGHFKRQDSLFRNWITKDGQPGPTGSGGFAAEAGRYHLYVSWACPWAHRTVIFRHLKGLDSMISLSAVHWLMGDQGWSFQPDDGVIADPIHQAEFMHQIYTAAKPDYTGRVTVPVLWDRRTNAIVSNESSEIIQMFNSAFDDIGARPGDYFPADLVSEMAEINDRIYHDVNNGVYKSGFATSQDAYEQSVATLFEALDWLEDRLAGQRWLMGDRLTAADWRLFPTLLRFDPVYYGHFKCSRRQLADYPNLWGYTRDLYQQPGIAQTVNMTHIRRHYHQSHPSINPHGILPEMPLRADFSAPHDRARLG